MGLTVASVADSGVLHTMDTRQSAQMYVDSALRSEQSLFLLVLIGVL